MKKVMAIVVGLALVLTVAGCAKGGDQSDGDGGTSTSADAASVDTSSTTSAPEPEIEYVEPPAEDFKYSYNEGLGGVEITGYYGEDTAIRIPSEIDGYAVTTLNGAFQRYTFNASDLITNIIIPDSVTWIGPNAFSGCSSLTSITIPDSVEEIDEYAFLGCPDLTIKYKGKIYTSEDDCFYRELFKYNYLEELDGVAIYDYIGRGTSIRIPSEIDGYTVKMIVGGPFSNFAFVDDPAYDRNVTNIIIPDSVTIIGDTAFANCTSLTSITIPNSVTVIDHAAFYNCTSLTSIAIPDSVTKIGRKAFEDCISLTSITIPNSVTVIDDSAFYGCSSLTGITIPNSVTEIGIGVFTGCTSLTSLTIPDSVTEFGWYIFEGCDNLTVTYKGETYTKQNDPYGWWK